MRSSAIYLALASLALVLVVAACGQAASPTVPTTAPTQSVAGAQATPATAAPPATQTSTGSSAQAASFPEQGRPITILVPFDAGSAPDVIARVLAPILERDLGTSVQVVQRVGGGSQVMLTDLSNAAPDGYTMGVVLINPAITSYLDPGRGATYSRSSFQPVAAYSFEPYLALVQNVSPWTSAADMVEAAKASPGQVRTAISGAVMSSPHFGAILLEEAAGVRFALSAAGSSSRASTELLGGHADMAIGTAAGYASPLQSGAVRVLGVMHTQESPFFPGVPTFEAQGYQGVVINERQGLALPANTPPAVVDVLRESMRKAVQSGELEERLSSLRAQLDYLDAPQFEAEWAESETKIQPLMDLARQRQ